MRQVCLNLELNNQDSAAVGVKNVYRPDINVGMLIGYIAVGQHFFAVDGTEYSRKRDS